MDDRNLSGNDLKVVEYSIVSVKPELRDDHRLLTGHHPYLISFTDDMTGEDFVTWIVASYLQTPEGIAKKVQHKDKKYLRVCWRVMCRFSIEDTDYQEKQADYLKDISQTLKEKYGHGDEDVGGSSGSGGGPAGKARRGGK